LQSRLHRHLRRSIYRAIRSGTRRGPARTYYRNHWDALFRFIDEPDIPIDNSASEREFQAVAKLRLNSLFAGGTEGAHRAAVLLGIAATCRAIGIDSLAYMAWAFERLGTHREHFALELADLTPAAFKRLPTTT